MTVIDSLLKEERILMVALVELFKDRAQQHKYTSYNSII